VSVKWIGIVFGLVPLLAVFLFAVYAVLARTVIHGPVTPDSLGVSVAEEGGSMFAEFSECRPAARAREWRCTFSVDGSSGAEFRVRVRDGSSCWDASRVHGTGLDRRLSGCVHRWQWSLL
jgi:hypothetical protein